MRLYPASAVVLLAIGGCALPVDRTMTPQAQLAASPLMAAVIDRPPVDVPALDSYAAVENEATGSVAPVARTPDAPFRKVKKHVYLLLGGLQGMDGWVTSAGMFGLRSSLAALPDVTVTTYGWRSYKKVSEDIALLPTDDIVIVIGYSGGGAKATWLANLPSKPQIDLMVVYDPSPPWGMQVIGPNVKRALCYCNVTPAFFGLGGAVLRGRGTDVETVNIYEQHLLVQINTTLHQRTIEEVRKISKVSSPVDFPRAAGSQTPG